VIPIATASNTVRPYVKVHGDGAFDSIAITPDGKTAYAGGGNPTQVISTATHTITTTLPVISNAMAVTPCLPKTPGAAR
jgi:DNA-binding beta-propeller fold protein YncE